jgi:hypothetical protein
MLCLIKSLKRMSRRIISLKSRVRYEGLALSIDRRADLEQLPDPIWYTVGQVLRKKYRRGARSVKAVTPTAP